MCRQSAAGERELRRAAPPIGTRHTSEITPTKPIGMSCSVRGSSAALPAARAREAAIAERSPADTGLTSFASVQIAATRIVPAPTKRTW